MKKLFLVLFALTCMVSLYAQQVTTAPADSTAKAKIVFETLAHDFSTINAGSDGNCVFKFKNEGTAPLILSNVQASCGCTTPVWTKEPIEAGKKGNIKVTYSTAGRPGIFTKTITVYSNDSLQQVVLIIKGEVIPIVKKVEPVAAKGVKQ